ncbi:MAG TPA: hypothetical protein VGL92_03690, partial [Acidimicrobiia bacterium]
MRGDLVGDGGGLREPAEHIEGVGGGYPSHHLQVDIARFVGEPDRPGNLLVTLLDGPRHHEVDRIEGQYGHQHRRLIGGGGHGIGVGEGGGGLLFVGDRSLFGGGAEAPVQPEQGEHGVEPELGCLRLLVEAVGESLHPAPEAGG